MRKSIIFLLMACFLLIVGATLIASPMGDSIIPVTIISLSILLFACAALSADENKNKDHQENKHLEREERELITREIIDSVEIIYDKFVQEQKKPSGENKVFLYPYWVLNCWKNEESLCFIKPWINIENGVAAITLPIEEIKEKHAQGMFGLGFLSACVIPLKNIKYFKEDGDVHAETKISGGGGGGSSLTGAVIGAVIAGSAGAIIGSRKSIDEIKSETVLNDQRTVTLYYYENENDTQMQHLVFSYDAYNIFLSLMPEKDYNFVISSAGKEPNSDDVKSKLQKLAELRDEGLITEDEYNQKRSVILDSII